MSRYLITKKSAPRAGATVRVGWQENIQSYWMDFYDEQKDVAFFATSYKKKYPTVESLQEAVKNYIEVVEPLLGELKLDRVRDRPDAPNRLDIWITDYPGFVRESTQGLEPLPAPSTQEILEMCGDCDVYFVGPEGLCRAQ